MRHTQRIGQGLNSAILVVFVLRTRLTFFQSKPGRALVLASVVVAVIALGLSQPSLSNAGFITEKAL